ncbi:hypothetical protein C2E23DRAFT_864336 [Lenzites betulinus]|nr:hypothetical protein C2E23DRAFT_864336 [Lenzites betulinus]
MPTASDKEEGRLAAQLDELRARMEKKRQERAAAAKEAEEDRKRAETKAEGKRKSEDKGVRMEVGSEKGKASKKRAAEEDHEGEVDASSDGGVQSSEFGVPTPGPGGPCSRCERQGLTCYFEGGRRRSCTECRRQKTQCTAFQGGPPEKKRRKVGVRPGAEGGGMSAAGTPVPSGSGAGVQDARHEGHVPGTREGTPGTPGTPRPKKRNFGQEMSRGASLWPQKGGLCNTELLYALLVEVQTLRREMKEMRSEMAELREQREEILGEHFAALIDELRGVEDAPGDIEAEEEAEMEMEDSEDSASEWTPEGSTEAE